jgi:hypothetical protein
MSWFVTVRRFIAASPRLPEQWGDVALVAVGSAVLAAVVVWQSL